MRNEASSLPPTSSTPSPTKTPEAVGRSSSGNGSRNLFATVRAPNAPRLLSGAMKLAVSLACVAAASLLRLQIDRLMGGHAPFLLFFSAIVVSSWFGGLWPGLLTTLISTLIDQFIFRALQQEVQPRVQILESALFIIEGSFVALIVSRLRSFEQTNNLTARALKDSENQYRRVLDTAYEGIWIADAQAQTIYVNDHIARMLGYDRNDILDHSVYDFIPIEELGFVEEQIARRRRGEQSQYELQLLRKDGSRVHVMVSSSPFTDDAGNIQGTLAMLTDITALKETEYSLAQSEERYRAFVAQSSEAIWCFELDPPMPLTLSQDEQIDYSYAHAQLTECNDVMARMYGFERADELIGLRLGDLLPPIEANLQYLRAFIESGYRLTDGETVEPDRNGRSHYFLNNLIGISNNGHLHRAWGTQRDITALKEAEAEREALLVSERKARLQAEAAQARWEFLADASAIMAQPGGYEANLKRVAQRAIGIFDAPLDADTHNGFAKIADWCSVEFLQEDGSMRRVLVAHRDEQMCRLVFELDRKYPSHNQEEGVPRAIRERRTQIYAEITDEMLQASAQDAEHLAIMRALHLRSVLFAPLLTRDQVLGVISFAISDDSHRFEPEDIAFGDSLARRLAIAIDNEQLLQETQAANHAKDQFLATLSHELRTPLNAILGWAHLLNSGKLDEESLKMATATIERNAHVQTQLVEDLLDFSRITVGKMKIDSEPVAVNQTVRNAIETVHPAAESKNIIIEYTTALREGEDCVNGDERRLHQVTWNLLSNAIKFTPNDGQVSVNLFREDDHVRIDITDTGVGIAPEFLPHVWEQFRQADSSSTRAHGGMGLGLSIVRTIVELHGGKVLAKSDGKGQGATFSVLLPLLETKA